MQNKEQQPQTFGPAPVDPNTQYQQQPVNQQYFAQPQAAPVQYVVMAESLKGIKGWLLFFTIVFAIYGIVFITFFFGAMNNSAMDSSAMNNATQSNSVVALIFTPLLAAASITTTVFLAMEKKLAKWLAVGTLGLVALYNIINAIVNFTAGVSEASAPSLISGIVITMIFSGLLMLYFFVSRRVKETLVR